MPEIMLERLKILIRPNSNKRISKSYTSKISTFCNVSWSYPSCYLLPTQFTNMSAYYTFCWQVPWHTIILQQSRQGWQRAGTWAEDRDREGGRPAGAPWEEKQTLSDRRYTAWSTWGRQDIRRQTHQGIIILLLYGPEEKMNLSDLHYTVWVTRGRQNICRQTHQGMVVCILHGFRWAIKPVKLLLYCLVYQVQGKPVLVNSSRYHTYATLCRGDTVKLL